MTNGRRIFWGAAAAGLALIAALELPGWIVRHGLVTESVSLLERWASRDTLLRAAVYGTDSLSLTNHLGRGFFPSTTNAAAATSAIAIAGSSTG